MTATRVHYLDWLKTLIVYGIVVFHVSLVFAAGSWLVSNHGRSLILSGFAGFCFPWGIPAMFLIAGADAWFGLRSHSAREFAWRRVQRLLLPMLAGLVVLSPYQRFIVSHNPPPPIQELPAFYVHFFRTFHFDASLQWISTYWLHLWFLGYLFAISLACLPFLLWLRRESGRRFSARLVIVASRRGGLFLLGAPLILLQLVLRPLFPSYQDWADLATYTLAFMWGAVLFSDRGFEPAIRREIRWILAAGIAAVIGIAALFSGVLGEGADTRRLPEFQEAAFAFLWSVDIWCWLLAVLYLGIRWLDFPSRIATYGEESILPVYVVHHPVVITIASFVVTWNLGVWAKFAFILATTFAVTLTIYEFGIRRWPPMRALFGLGPRRRRRAQEPDRYAAAV